MLFATAKCLIESAIKGFSSLIVLLILLSSANAQISGIKSSIVSIRKDQTIILP
jgi:hypothetical protein